MNLTPLSENWRNLCVRIKLKLKSKFDLTVIGLVLPLRIFFSCFSPCFLFSFNAISHHFFLPPILILPFGVPKYLIGFEMSEKNTRLFDVAAERPFPHPDPARSSEKSRESADLRRVAMETPTPPVRHCVRRCRIRNLSHLI